jgi:hypothetical protein
MSVGGGTRWQSIAHVARITGLSDETIRKYCIAIPKVHFPSARMVDDRWEIPDDEARAAKVVDRALVLARTGLSEPSLTQLERLGKISCNSEGKFSLDQEVYLHTAKRLERGEGNTATRANDLDDETAALVAESTAPANSPSNQDGQAEARPGSQVGIVLVRPGLPLMQDFVEYMTEHKDPARLADEFFAGQYAPAFIPPVGVEYYVALGPGPAHDVDGPSGTWVRRYPRWSYDGKNLVCDGQTELLVDGLFRRGAIPEQYAHTSAAYRLLEAVWNARAIEARGRLKEKARVARVAFLPDLVWRPDVPNWIRRYQEERLHPSEFPDSVRAALVNVPFLPTFNMFSYESTGEVRKDPSGGTYTVIGVSRGYSDEFGWGADMSPEAALRSELMWPGRHAKGEVPPWYAPANAEYLAAKAAWEQMQREGRALKAERGE